MGWGGVGSERWVGSGSGGGPRADVCIVVRYTYMECTFYVVSVGVTTYSSDRGVVIYSLGRWVSARVVELSDGAK
jgi:hypothetical protein